MNICVCSSCSKKILVSKVLDNKCYACGTRCNVDIENSGTYLEGVIEECEKELFAQKYSRAMELYDKYIELFPNISTLYWGRFMASNSSCNVEQLLKQGIPFEESSDYQVAIHFASDNEKECYEYIAQKRREIAQKLVDELEIMKKTAIRGTGIEAIQKETMQELNVLRMELSKKMADLDISEKYLRDKTADCDAQINSGKEIIDSSVSKIEKCKSQINGKRECEDDEFQRFMIEIKKNAAVCDSVWGKTSHLSTTKFFVDRDSCINRQKTAESALNSVINSIENINTKMEKLLLEITQITKRYTSASNQTRKSGFSEAVSLLGSRADDIIDDIIRA